MLKYIFISLPVIFFLQAEGSNLARRNNNKTIVESSLFDFKGGFDWLNGFSIHEINTESPLNPYNRVAEIENFQLKTDLRGDFKIKYLNAGQVVFRPRLEINGTETHYSDKDESIQRTKAKSDLSEFFFEFWLGDHVTVAAGLQSYQWGPAEFISPTNPIFHLNPNQKSFFFKEKGRILSRLNLSFSDNFSLVFFQEFMDNQERFWIADRSFEKKSIAKFEYRASDNANRYIGLVRGEQEARIPFYGSYANFNFLETYSFYYDVKSYNGSIAYYPKTVNGQLDIMDQSDEQLHKNQSYGTVGFRWESKWDFRLEYIYNSAGYSKADFDRSVQSALVTNPYFINNINRLARSGLELLGQNYLYSSLRIPDLGVKKDGTLFFRYFQSLQDQSSSLQVNLEKALNDMLICNFEVTSNFGGQQSEFTLLEKGNITAGLKLSW